MPRLPASGGQLASAVAGHGRSDDRRSPCGERAAPAEHSSQGFVRTSPQGRRRSPRWHERPNAAYRRGIDGKARVRTGGTTSLVRGLRGIRCTRARHPRCPTQRSIAVAHAAPRRGAFRSRPAPCGRIELRRRARHGGARGSREGASEAREQLGGDAARGGRGRVAFVGLGARRAGDRDDDRDDDRDQDPERPKRCAEHPAHARRFARRSIDCSDVGRSARARRGGTRRRGRACAGASGGRAGRACAAVELRRAMGRGCASARGRAGRGGAGHRGTRRLRRAHRAVRRQAARRAGARL